MPIVGEMRLQSPFSPMEVWNGQEWVQIGGGVRWLPPLDSAVLMALTTLRKRGLSATDADVRTALMSFVHDWLMALTTLRMRGLSATDADVRAALMSFVHDWPER